MIGGWQAAAGGSCDAHVIEIRANANQILSGRTQVGEQTCRPSNVIAVVL